MPRKIFLSFLGINNYEPVSYYTGQNPPAPLPPTEKYVQKAILNHLSTFFASEDQVVIFLTKEARQANWENDGHINRTTQEPIPNTGLQSSIEQSNYPFKIVDVDIQGESDENAIWNTFLTIFNYLEPEDEVYLDITHSWRYLPMLGMTLLNYAKALKNIQVKAIYYGALERLGNFMEVRDMPLDERPVPILNLVSFSDLQDWSAAAHDFVHYGKTHRWNALSSSALKPFLKGSAGKDQVAANLRQISKLMQNLTSLIATNRGKSLSEFQLAQLQSALNDFSAEQSYIKPLNAIIELVQKKITPFDVPKELVWLQSVKWCIDHGLIQQGITQLQEGILTYLCHYFEKMKLAPGFFDWQKETPRNLLGTSLNFINEEPPEHDWRGIVAAKKHLTRQVMKFHIMKKLAPTYAALTTTRNDINHGGYTRHKKAMAFYSELDKHYQQVKSIIEDLGTSDNQPLSGLLNLSNHPSAAWSEAQQQAAIDQYGAIEDLPFPRIDPQSTEEEIEQLADDYLRQILERRPAAVHLMGEMTFTFTLINKLKDHNIPCLASTSERQVTEKDGQKIVRFQFVQFRPYT